MSTNNIHTAIIEVMKKVGYVKKDGKVEFKSTKYSYAGEAHLIAALRPVMLECGITFFCNKSHVHSISGNILTSEHEFTFTHADSDTSIVVQAIGQGADSQDKGAYKAMTGALKYALRQTFIIETGDDPDKYSSEEIIFDTATARNKRFKKVKNEIEDANTFTELENVWDENQPHLAAFRRQDENFYNDLIRAKDKRKSELEVKPKEEKTANIRKADEPLYAEGYSQGFNETTTINGAETNG